ncbi:MAG: hydroxymethylglutaryl-CoA reductase, degradative [Candidatus Thorarchaeota archaeon]|nr:hydroxymethylglutaryl-CoA reductase, degradative [Candidatus Thorarchaeota archaeon]MCK5238228.1 hydroxymethylglutaryl-CoA reductase, degradative [Candidatus Thorarchaeota archaeon]
MVEDSRISGFYKLSREERVKKLAEVTGIPIEELGVLSDPGKVDMEILDNMVENVVGAMTLPLGIATNFRINSKDYLIPMALEEPSVVAAASNAARMARTFGGFSATDTGPVMIAQIQAINVPAPFEAKLRILEAKEEIIELANKQDPILVKFGGGAKDVRVRVIDTSEGPMVITELIVDTRDAMGANAVNTMCEALAPMIEKISKGKVLLRILSNLADKRLVRVRATFDKDLLGGEEVVDAIISAWAFAEADPYRCSTHNKGIMNGIDAVVIATGNDFRAIEAGAHSYAAVGGYSSLTKYEKDTDGHLLGSIEIPMAVGLIGGATKVHPVARTSVRILGVETAVELGHVIASVGLAQNLAALRALGSEGIQKGHMALHARNVAATAGAKGDFIERVAEILVREKNVKVERAKEVLEDLKKN